ncbi:MAG TPA: rRNA maturation RNase YbeY [Spirochaetota bacterium]|nr:rRNA maturation RNase YbeY [Spirochaetota bacterium]
MRNIEIFTEGNINLPYKNLAENFFLSITDSTLIETETDNVSVNLILTDDEYIKSINSGYRGKDKPTDVISFAYRDDPFPVIDNPVEELGDIYISLERASEQAVEYEVTLADELKRLVIHGVLHLLGYDHELSEEDEKRMNILEEKIFNAIKI